MSSAATAATAHHEAGHAVAAFALRIAVKRVSIMPDTSRDAAGHVYRGRCRSVDAMHRCKPAQMWDPGEL